MSYSPAEKDDLSELFSRLNDINIIKPRLLSSLNKDSEFDMWMEKGISIDPRSTYIILRDNYSKMNLNNRKKFLSRFTKMIKKVI